MALEPEAIPGRSADGRNVRTWVPGVCGGAVAESQRARILDAMVEVVCECGFARSTVARVIRHAGVSRGTFYEQFDGLEECFAAILDDGLNRASAVILEAFAEHSSWRAGLRAGLAALLAFLDSEPARTRVWLVHAQAAGHSALVVRERNLATLRDTILTAWEPTLTSRRHSPPLAAEGVLASAFGVIHTHLLTGAPEPLTSLLGPLTGVVMAPYLSPDAVAREIERSEQLAAELQAQQPRARAPHTDPARAVSALPGVLSDRRADRARASIGYLAANPGAYNRQIARAIGVTHKGQMSSLLTRLAANGLVVKIDSGPGRPTRWELTDLGVRAAAVIEPRDTGEGSLINDAMFMSSNR